MVYQSNGADQPNPPVTAPLMFQFSPVCDLDTVASDIQTVPVDNYVVPDRSDLAHFELCTFKETKQPVKTKKIGFNDHYHSGSLGGRSKISNLSPFSKDNSWSFVEVNEYNATTMSRTFSAIAYVCNVSSASPSS